MHSRSSACSPACLVLGLFLLLTGCAGDTHAPSAPPLSAVAGIALPSPSSLAKRPAHSRLRTASSCDSVVQSGAAFDPSLPLQQVGPGFGGAAFTPSTVVGNEFGTMAYAVYSINAPGYLGKPELHTFWDSALPANALWLGIANFKTDRWDWFSPASPTLLNFGLVADHQSGGGTVFAAVVLLDTTGAELKMLRVGPPQVCGEVIQSPQAGQAPLTKSFDITGLYVVGETILGCDWDYDSDGTVDDTGTGLHLQWYPDPGDFPMTLTVQTNLGESISLIVPVRAMSYSWDSRTVAQNASGLHHFSSPHIALVGGVPMLAYIHKFDGDPPAPAYQTIEIIAADDRMANSWHYVASPVIGISRIYSLVDVGGSPVLLAASPSGGPLEKPIVAYAPDGLLAGWTVQIYLDVLSGAEREADMAIVGGNLSMAWRETGDVIRYSYCSGLDPTTWSPPLDIGFACNATLSLADVNGSPGIACTTGTQVMYLFSTSPTGDLGTWNPYYSNVAHNATPSLAYVGGYPLIAMDSAFDYYYAAGNSPDGTGPWRGFLPAGSNWTGTWCSIAGPCLDGLAAVASKSKLDNSLAFSLIYDDGSTMSNWFMALDGGAGLDVGEHCDLICVDSVPLVAYEDTTNDSIKVAVLR